MIKLTDKEQGFAHLGLISIAAVVVIVGVGIYVAKHSSGAKLNSASQTPTVSSIKPLSDNLTGVLSEDQIKQIAAKDKPGSVVSQIGLVETDNGPVFNVQLEDGSSLDLNAKTGDKVEENKVDDNSDGSKLPSNFTPTIDFSKAEQIAQAQITKGAIMRIQLEVEDGVPVYSVRFSTGAKVEINANDGTLIKIDASKSQGKQPTGTSESSQQESGNINKTENGSEPTVTNEAGSASKSDQTQDGSGGNTSGGTSGSDDSSSGGGH